MKAAVYDHLWTVLTPLGNIPLFADESTAVNAAVLVVLAGGLYHDVDICRRIESGTLRVGNRAGILGKGMGWPKLLGITNAPSIKSKRELQDGKQGTKDQRLFQHYLFPEMATQYNGQQYEPLSSVWERSDGELLEAILRFYPTINPEPILDSTYNTGRFWKGLSWDVWSMDIDAKYKPRIVGDNRVMKGIPF